MLSAHEWRILVIILNELLVALTKPTPIYYYGEAGCYAKQPSMWWHTHVTD